MGYNLYSEFDFEQHAKHFICYCEVIIDEDGVCHYAIPSHQQYLIKMICKKRNISRKQFEESIKDMLFIDIDWLLEQANAIAVYYEFYIGKPNDKQQATLNKLQETGCTDF